MGSDRVPGDKSSLMYDRGMAERMDHSWKAVRILRENGASFMRGNGWRTSEEGTLVHWSQGRYPATPTTM